MNRSRSTNLCLAGLSVLLVSSAVLLGSAMTPKIVDGKEFSVIGIEARTNNSREMTNDGVIPRQWGKFFAEGILAKIPNKVDPTIYAVYTDYASDRNGDYTFFIGAKVSDTSRLRTLRSAQPRSAGFAS